MLRWWHHRGITGARRVCNRFWYGGLLSGRRLSLLARMWAGGWALISVFWCETFHGEKTRCTMHCTCHYRYIFWVYVDVNQLLNCTVNDDLLWNVCHDLLRTCYVTVSSNLIDYHWPPLGLDGLMHWNQFQWYIWAIHEMPQNDPFPKKWLCACDLDFWGEWCHDLNMPWKKRDCWVTFGATQCQDTARHGSHHSPSSKRGNRERVLPDWTPLVIPGQGVEVLNGVGHQCL